MEASSGLNIFVQRAHERGLGSVCIHSALRGLLAGVPLWAKGNRSSRSRVWLWSQRCTSQRLRSQSLEGKGSLWLQLVDYPLIGSVLRILLELEKAPEIILVKKVIL